MIHIYLSEVEEGRWFRGISEWNKSTHQLNYIFCLKGDHMVVGTVEDPFQQGNSTFGEWKDRPKLATFTSMPIEDFEVLKRTNRFLFHMNSQWELLYAVQGSQVEYNALYENHIFQESASVTR